MAQPAAVHTLSESYSIIELNAGLECIVDTEDYVLLSRYTWTHKPNYATGYAHTKIKNKQIMMHRLLMGHPEGMLVDHINSNGLDNRKSNLRIVTKSQNGLNCRKSKSATSRFYGVPFHTKSGTWCAQGTSALTGKAYGLGYYKSEISAALAYNRFCAEHNPYSKLNVI
jgi:hypothetical protein